MHEYEVMFVIDPKLEEEAIDVVIKRFEDLIAGRGGELLKTDKWGRRRLSYEVKGNIEGFYVMIDFKSESPVAQEVERVLKIAGEVIRYLIVRKDE